MQPGILRHRVTPQKALETITRGKRSAVTWINLPKRWAAINPLSGRELEYARQMVAEATHEVRMRYTNEVTEKMRLEYDGRFFHIQHIADKDERRVELRLICVEQK